LSFEISFARFAAIAAVVPPAKARKLASTHLKKTGKPDFGLLIMMSFCGPTEDTTLKLGAAKPVLIKIKNQPEEKPENLMIICLFLSVEVWQ
jgi:hypothetical protein